MSEERCIICKRIPFYCECHKSQQRVAIKEESHRQQLPSDMIDVILDQQGYIGYAVFCQTEKNASKIMETYWMNYFIKKTDIPGYFESDKIHYKTKLLAMNGILTYLGL